MWWKDADSVFLGCNEILANYVGLNTADEIIGLTDFDIFDSKEEAESVRKIDQEIIKSGNPQLNFEECLTLGGVGRRWLSTSKIPLRDDQNTIIGTIGWFQDITELKEMQIRIDENNKTLYENNLQLKQANHQLEAANFDLERFTYAASHDLKSPVITMKSFLSLIMEKTDRLQDPKMSQYLEFVNRSADRMQKLIDDILDYARTGVNHYHAEEVHLHQIVTDKLIDIESFTDVKNPVIKLDLPTTRIKVYPKLLGLVFYNLINNGIRYNVSETPTISISHEETAEYWIFSVEDNGIGVDAKFTEEVFKPFTRLASKSHKGSGLGLSICKRVVALHNGEIWIEKSQSGNTVFKFSISKILD